MIPITLTFVVGAGIGAGGTYAILSQRKSQPADKPAVQPVADTTAIVPPRATPRTLTSDLQYSPALKYGIPVSDYLRFFSDYVSSFDGFTRNPRWVIEHITKDSVVGPGDRKKSDFFEDTAIEQRFRSKLSDYRRSGYDRGHLAPAGNHKSSQQAMDDTFSLSNMSPQVGDGFNRDYWARFEEFARSLTKQADEVFVITGPLYLPRLTPDNKWQMQYSLIGKAPQLVAVPTHFFKIILAENKDKQQTSVGAFVMQNAPIDPNVPLSAFVVPLEDLESAAGTKFFPYFLTEERRRAVDASARFIRGQGLQMLPQANTNLLAPVLTDSSSSTAIVPARPPPVAGTRHLCEAFACKLPAERFFESAKGSAAKS